MKNLQASTPAQSELDNMRPASKFYFMLTHPPPVFVEWLYFTQKASTTLSDLKIIWTYNQSKWENIKTISNKFIIMV